MVRQAHHPEPSRRVNLKSQNSITENEVTSISDICFEFGYWIIGIYLYFGICDLRIIRDRIESYESIIQ